MIRSQTARLVAPRVGAWIETLLGAGLNLFGQSLPVWERGLKQTALLLLHLYSVAPRVGAWIETLRLLEALRSSVSLPVWERGLKQRKQLGIE